MTNHWKVNLDGELKKNEKLRKEDINIVQEWICKQPHLPRIADNQVILFLHASCYSIEETKKLIDNFYTLRTRYEQFFSNRDPFHSYIQQCIQVAACVIYGKDYCGRSILWTKLIDTDPQMYYPTICSKVMFMVSDIDHLENGTVPGYTMVLDGKNFGIQHAMRCSFVNARNMITYVQTASTVVIEKVLILNMTPAAEKVMAILKPFIRSELFNKITICPGGSYDELFTTIPKETIPADYNGEAPNISELNSTWKLKLESYAEWFSEEEKLRVNEAKRMCDSPFQKDAAFGVEGSFKALAID